MRSGNIKEKFHLQPKGLSAHYLTMLTLSSAPNSNISQPHSPPDSKSFGSWQAYYGQWGPTALNKKFAC